MEEKPKVNPIGNDEDSRGGYGDRQDVHGGQPDPKDRTADQSTVQGGPVRPNAWVRNTDEDVNEEGG